MAFDLTSYQVILASHSPRRQELLKILGLTFVVRPPLFPIDETPLVNESPLALVQRLSRAKAQAVITNMDPGPRTERLPTTGLRTDVVIGADTVVVLDDQILGKPNDAAEATVMLKQLRGRWHYVYSGLTAAILTGTEPANPSTMLRTGLVTRFHQSKVWMRSYSDAEIAAYVASRAPLDKAGAYGIQDKGFEPVERLEGCYAGVMGLPLIELVAVLKEAGLPLPETGRRCAEYTGYSCCI